MDDRERETSRMMIQKIEKMLERIENAEKETCRLVVEALVHNGIRNYLVDEKFETVTGRIDREDKTLPLEVKIRDGEMKVIVKFPFLFSNERIVFAILFLTEFNGKRENEDFVMRINGKDRYEITLEAKWPIWRPAVYSEAEVWNCLDAVIRTAEAAYHELNRITCGRLEDCESTERWNALLDWTKIVLERQDKAECSKWTFTKPVTEIQPVKYKGFLEHLLVSGRIGKSSGKMLINKKKTDTNE